jgi:hypothetical protein
MKINEGYYICQPGLAISPPIFENINRCSVTAHLSKAEIPLFRVYPATDHDRVGNQSAAHQKPAHIIR